MNTLTLNEISKITIEDADELFSILSNYADSELFFNFKNGNYIIKDQIPDSKETWKAIAEALSCTLNIDYVSSSNLERLCKDELSSYKGDIDAYRSGNTVWNESDYNSFLDNIESYFEKNIALFQKYLRLIRAERLVDKIKYENVSKIYEETAENFVEKSELFSVDDVAKLCDESPETIKNFCLFQKYIDKDNLPTLYGYEVTKYIYKSLIHNEFFFTIAGKDHVVAVYDSIKKAEKGLKPNSIGLAE